MRKTTHQYNKQCGKYSKAIFTAGNKSVKVHTGQFTLLGAEKGKHSEKMKVCSTGGQAGAGQE